MSEAAIPRRAEVLVHDEHGREVVRGCEVVSDVRCVCVGRRVSGVGRRGAKRPGTHGMMHSTVLVLIDGEREARPVAVERVTA